MFDNTETYEQMPKKKRITRWQSQGWRPSAELDAERDWNAEELWRYLTSALECNSGHNVEREAEIRANFHSKPPRKRHKGRNGKL